MESWRIYHSPVSQTILGRDEEYREGADEVLIDQGRDVALTVSRDGR